MTLFEYVVPFFSLVRYVVSSFPADVLTLLLGALTVIVSAVIVQRLFSIL